jgi:hypothetical protein
MPVKKTIPKNLLDFLQLHKNLVPSENKKTDETYTTSNSLPLITADRSAFTTLTDYTNMATTRSSTAHNHQRMHSYWHKQN